MSSDGYSEEEFEDEEVARESSSLEGNNDDNKGDVNTVDDLKTLLARARSTMTELKTELDIDDVDIDGDRVDIDNYDLSSPASSHHTAADKNNNLASNLLQANTKPKIKYNRSSWITASQGEGKESKHVPSDDSINNLASEVVKNYGLTKDVQLQRKAATAVSFAPPSHVERTVIREKKKPDFRSKFDTRKRKKPAKSTPSDLDFARRGSIISRWGSNADRRATAVDAVDEDEHDVANDGDLVGVDRNANKTGTVFGRPAHVDPVEIRKPPEKEPITKRGKRLKEERDSNNNNNDESEGERTKRAIKQNRTSKARTKTNAMDSLYSKANDIAQISLASLELFSLWHLALSSLQGLPDRHGGTHQEAQRRNLQQDSTRVHPHSVQGHRVVQKEGHNREGKRSG